jgi:hypothetical protein
MVWVLFLAVLSVGVRADDALPTAPEIAPDIVNFSKTPFLRPRTIDQPSWNLTTLPTVSYSFSSSPSTPPPIGSTPPFMTPFAICSLSLCAWMFIHLQIARRRNIVTRSSSRRRLGRFTALLAIIMVSIVASSAVVAVLVQSPRPSAKWAAGPLIQSVMIASALPVPLLAGLFLARRRLFGYFAMICLMLSALSITLWVRSYRHTEWLERKTELPGKLHIARTTVRFVSNAGGVRLLVISSPWLLPEAPKVPSTIDTGWYFNRDSEQYDYASNFFVLPNDWSPLGFALYKESGRAIPPLPPDKAFHVIAPVWSLTLILLILPAIWLLKTYRRMMRTARNLCSGCAYDLRATPDRCPECGVVQA